MAAPHFRAARGLLGSALHPMSIAFHALKNRNMITICNA